jgi:hypothetical protein
MHGMFDLGDVCWAIVLTSTGTGDENLNKGCVSVGRQTQGGREGMRGEMTDPGNMSLVKDQRQATAFTQYAQPSLALLIESV